MIGKNLLVHLRQALNNDNRRVCYGQSGEDLIIAHLFSLIGITCPTYLDIGAHHPTYLSNTYYFYKRGSRGVCVEPNPDFHAIIQKKRPRDTCLNIGIGFGDTHKMRFYILDSEVLSTFSEDVLREQLADGRIVKKELDVTLEPINGIIEKYLLPHPNLVSLDTEGLDLTILQSLDFKKYRPEAFCVETIANIGGRKIDAIVEFMAAQNYVVFADTHINTIFVEGDLWRNRLEQLAQAGASGDAWFKAAPNPSPDS